MFLVTGVISKLTFQLTTFELIDQKFGKSFVFSPIIIFIRLNSSAWVILPWADRHQLDQPPGADALPVELNIVLQLCGKVTAAFAVLVG